MITFLWKKNGEVCIYRMFYKKEAANFGELLLLKKIT